MHSPRKLCAQYARYAVQCWYRYWIEQAPGPVILGARDLLRLCHGLAGTQREGCIVNISSVFGLLGYPAQGAYNMSKFAVRGLTECLWAELDAGRVPAWLEEIPGSRADQFRVYRVRRYPDP